MKEGISNIWLIGIIVVFIFIFACYISVTIGYTAAFKLKNESLKIIEKHKGMTNQESNKMVPSVVKSGESVHGNVGALQTINLYLLGNAYTATGHCPKPTADGRTHDTWYGVKSLEYESSTGFFEEAQADEKYYYCFARYAIEQRTAYAAIHYKLRLFYKMEFPFLSEFLAVKVDGITDEIYNPQDLVSDDPSSESIWKTNTELYGSSA